MFKDKLTARDLEGLIRPLQNNGHSNTDTISNVLTLASKRLDLVL